MTSGFHQVISHEIRQPSTVNLFPSSQILPHNRHPSPHSKSLAAYADDGAELVAFIFVAVYEFEYALYEGLIQTHGNDLFGSQPFFDIEVEDLIQDLVFR